MKKKEIEAVIAANKCMHTNTLLKAEKKLKDMIDERETTHSMYFWTPGASASERRYHEEQRNIGLTADLKNFHVEYDRHYSESCRYVYASDSITAEQNENCVSLTVADLKKLIAGIEAIITRRGAVA